MLNLTIYLYDNRDFTQMPAKNTAVDTSQSLRRVFKGDSNIPNLSVKKLLTILTSCKSFLVYHRV